MTFSWNGVFPAATTQFTGDESLDLPATTRHLDHLINEGVHGLIVLGTVGENCSLERTEKIAVLKATVQAARGRVPVLTGVAECTTAGACRFAVEARAAGAAGLMVLPAMVYKSDPRETIAHFRAVAGATDLPILIYNNPVSYGVDIAPAMFAEMADEPNFAAIKESSENPRRITDIRNACGDRYAILGGVDDLALECAMLGACGWISGLVNAFPVESLRLWRLATTGRFEEALPLYRWFTPLLHQDTHVKLVQYIKLAMAEVGLGAETVRAPRMTLVGKERDDVLAIIHAAIMSRPKPEARWAATV